MSAFLRPISALLLLCEACFSPEPVAPEFPPDAGDVGGGPEDTVPGEAGPGVVVFTRAGSVWRVEATPSATPENLTAALDNLNPADEEGDSFINVSPDGGWFVLHTDRFDDECRGWPCLALVRGDLSEAREVRAGGEAVHPEGAAAVANGGELIVFAATGGPHEIDLFTITREGGDWSRPRMITGASAHAYNAYPAISGDGTRVVFDCGPTQYGMEGTNICAVKTDGGSFAELARADAPPPGLSNAVALHHPDYAPDGSVIFEGNYDGEQIWRIPVGGGTPQRVGAPVQDSTDNSPCVLPDGRVVTVTHAVPSDGGGQGKHELKVIDNDDAFMLVRGGNLVDEGIGCGGATTTTQ